MVVREIRKAGVRKVGLMNLDISANRRAAKYSVREQFARVLWMLATPLFRYSPNVFFRWRTFLLKLFGAKVGRHVHVYRTAQIQFPWKLTIGDWSAIGPDARVYNLGQLTVGESVTISQYAHLCGGSHDYKKSSMDLEKCDIVIQDFAWIAADAYVGPKVHVGEGAVVGARAVVTKDVPAWTIVAGNPAESVGLRNEPSKD